MPRPSTGSRSSRPPRHRYISPVPQGPIVSPTTLTGTLEAVVIHKQALARLPQLESYPVITAATLDELQPALLADPRAVAHPGRIVRTIAMDPASPTGKVFRAFLVS